MAVTSRPWITACLSEPCLREVSVKALSEICVSKRGLRTHISSHGLGHVCPALDATYDYRINNIMTCL